jgi:hypothetical protein
MAVGQQTDALCASAVGRLLDSPCLYVKRHPINRPKRESANHYRVWIILEV